MAEFTQLGFDEAKENIIKHLQAQEGFTDYDYTGSNLNIMIDALAYTLVYTGVYGNMAISEIFMDSAQVRNNVVSRAKNLSYMPRQINSSFTTIAVRVPRPDSMIGNSSLIMAKGTRFTSTLDEVSYDYVITDDTRLIYDGVSDYVNDNVTIRQGSFQTQEWDYSSKSKDRYIITQSNIDSEFLSLNIQDSIASSNVEPWTMYDEITTIDNETKAYFIQESEDQRVEIYFGDGVVGYPLIDGNIIIAEYLVTKGKDANGCNEFELITDVKGINKNKFTISSNGVATSGADAESIESIKFNAPRSFSAQKRAVTVPDYESVLSEKYGAIETMNVWGGEDNVPPIYGKVFACIKPTYGLELSPAVKARITDEILSKYKMVGIIPTLVNADYTYINMNTILDVNMGKTTLADGQLINLVTQGINDYFVGTLNKFNTSFKYSNVSSLIDNISNAVLSSQTTVSVSKKIIPLASVARTYEFSYNNAILPNTLSTNEYTNDGGLTFSYIKDNGNGVLQSFYKGAFVADIGVVDYETGNVSISSFVFYTPANTTIEFKANPKTTDISSVRNNLIIAGSINVTIPETIIEQ